MSIRVHHITKTFGSFTALLDVSLEVPGGGLLALLGPSGSGKTTLLRVIAGLETPDDGTVIYHDEDVTARTARDRNVGFVFQHYALFKQMTVYENIAFGLRVRHRSRAEIERRVTELINLVRLTGMERRFPAQLSGGQCQRVALARALAIQPEVLLLDEPFGALDAKVRQELRQWLRRLHDEIGMTTVFVTHDQEEAFEVADTVVVMNRGRIEQIGSPEAVFNAPANSFVMDFLGNVNVFHGRVHDGRAQLGSMEVDVPNWDGGASREARVYVRPHELEVHRQKFTANSIQATVRRVQPVGAVTKLLLSDDQSVLELQVEMPTERWQELDAKVGDPVFVAPRRVRVFSEEAEYMI